MIINNYDHQQLQYTQVPKTKTARTGPRLRSAFPTIVVLEASTVQYIDMYSWVVYSRLRICSAVVGGWLTKNSIADM